MAATVELPWVAWPVGGLDPGEVAERAYWGYRGFDTDGQTGIDGKSCAYAVFNAIIGKLNAGATYPLPEEMTQYGHGGISGMGHICGALNGASAVINLIKGKTKIKENLKPMDSLIKQLIWWYEQEEHPNYDPKDPKLIDGTVYIPPTIVPRSSLCHVFVTKWCHEYGYKTNDPQRGECCARLAGEVAAQTVELLNGVITGYERPAVVDRCLSCHGPDAMDNVKGEMDCLLCHGPGKVKCTYGKHMGR
ncbi:MAG: C-GCAxxG-C-C family protein [Thermodesulfobacteriota bacterium]